MKKTKGVELNELMNRAEKVRAQNEAAENLRRAGDASLWRRQAKEAQAEVIRLQDELNLLLGIRCQVFTDLVIPAPNRKANGESVAALICSDWHVYETVKPEEVGGLNEYNAQIAAGSLETLFQAALRLVEIERAGTKIQTFILALLGDLMTSQIHEDQMECNAGTAQEEILFLLERISAGIHLLLEAGDFEQIIVPCCDGNHGRATEKIRVSNRVKHSNEWLLYRILAKQFADEPRVQFQIADGYHLYTQLFGRWIRWHHGDSIRYQGGIGGLTIPVRKAISEWNKGRRADLDVFGHWHTSHMDRDFISNGSAVGYSPYAVRIKAPFESPAQTLAVFESKRWLTSYRPVYVR